MNPAVDLVGLTFGRLTVISRWGTDRHGRSTWRCRCKCGKECTVPAGNLRRGNSKSCGCARIKNIDAQEYWIDKLVKDPGHCPKAHRGKSFRETGLKFHCRRCRILRWIKPKEKELVWE